MKNNPNETPLTSAEYFLLMRLLQTLENKGTLPEGQDWQAIYEKLEGGCLVARRQQQITASKPTAHAGRE